MFHAYPVSLQFYLQAIEAYDCWSLQAVNMITEHKCCLASLPSLSFPISFPLTAGIKRLSPPHHPPKSAINVILDVNILSTQTAGMIKNKTL